MNLVMKRFVKLLSLAGMVAISSNASASGFQLLEQDVTSVSNYHAGYAALANNASINFYNPAGNTLFKNQEVVISAMGAFTDIKYDGTIAVNTLNGGDPQVVTAQGGGFNFIPAINYVAPISDRLGFGFAIVAPFGLKSDYGYPTILRYAATLSSTQVVDISPSLGYQVTDNISLGAGLDVQKMNAEFDLVGVLGDDTDTVSTNKVSDTAYGFHLGGLYQFNPNSRVGLSYHSKVSHHLSGKSQFVGPLALAFNDSAALVSNNAKVNMPLPAYTALSGFHRFTDSKWALMGTAMYTQWNVVNALVLQNVAGIDNFTASTEITVEMPQYYKNTWNFSVGTDYYYSDEITFRGGVGYDQSPIQNRYRTVQLPDANRYAVALGGHYQATKTIGVDMGWTHLFIRQAVIKPPALSLELGDEQVTTVGNSTGGADVIGMQVVWDMI